jgi:hypothetical protein
MINAKPTKPKKVVKPVKGKPVEDFFKALEKILVNSPLD